MPDDIVSGSGDCAFDNLFCGWKASNVTSSTYSDITINDHVIETEVTTPMRSRRSSVATEPELAVIPRVAIMSLEWPWAACRLQETT